MSATADTPDRGYPHAYEVDVALRDGSTLHVRPVRADDRRAVEDFLQSVSPDSIAFRFFGAADLDSVARWFTDVDYADRYALVASTGPDGEIVGHGAYVRIDELRAEVAFLIADPWQGRGIATIMLLHLAAAADERGITSFIASVLPHNERMLKVFSESGFSVKSRTEEGVVEIELPTSLSAAARERVEQRDQTAAIAAMKSFLEPGVVAVVGASRRRGTVGGEILHNILSSGFTGAVYPVNPSANTVQAVHAYPTVGEVPERVDLAVIAVPAASVSEVARECSAAGVRGLLVVSAGFAEAGPEGVRRQEELLEVCRAGGMRLIGPNCLGELNTADTVRLDATFAARQPLPGRVGFLSQSGGLGIAMIEAAGRLRVGLSSFVSVGNKADISGNDLLQYWEGDPHTDVALLYLESFGNPRRFARIAPRVSAVKPIVAVKSGRTAAGARAGASHTGAIVSASDVTVDALFRQAGVIRTDTMHELFDVAALLSSQPVPAGERVAIVTNAGGPGILCADACQAGGLDVVALPEPVRRRLEEFLSPEASLGNPVDMIATATAEQYRMTVEVLAEASVCDAILVLFVPPVVTEAHDVAEGIRAAADAEARPRGVTVAAVFMSGDDAPSELGGDDERVPAFDFPEDAARALAHASRYARWRARPKGRIVQPADCRPAEAAAIIAQALAAGEEWIGPAQLAGLFAAYALPLIPTIVASDARAAVQAAAELGGPVALKALATGLLHKTDAGGVVLGLEGPRAVRAGVRQIEVAVRAAGHELEGLVVQPMAREGIELLMGIVHDESFGPVIACGAGGTRAELLGDVAVRITPLTDLDVREMLRSLRTFPLLEGYRGAPAADVPALEDVLLRLSAMVEAHPEIAELDANPVIASPDGAAIVDARVRLAAAPPRSPQPSL